MAPRLPFLSGRSGAMPGLRPGRPTRHPLDPMADPAQHAARRLRRLAGAGAALGLLLAIVLAVPAGWLAAALHQATGGRLQLLEAQGVWWSGSGLPLLTGGPGSRDAMLLPSRLHWRVGLDADGLRLELTQDCCLPQGLTLHARPGWGRLDLTLAPTPVPAQWPAAWVEGLGAPWNTLKPAGLLRLGTPGLRASLSRDGLHLDGTLELTLLGASSRLAQVDPLGDYRLLLTGHGPAPVQLRLETLSGALRLQASGQIGPRGLRLRGTADASPDQAAALNNLLNLIGRRQGAQSILSIG